MTIGDRIRDRPNKIPKAQRYPQARAVDEVLAGSVMASYSYTQHAGTLIATWSAPISRDRDSRDRVSQDRIVIAAWTYEHLQQYTHLTASVWWGFEPEDVTDDQLMIFDLEVNAGLLSEPLVTPIGGDAVPLVPPNLFDHYPSSGLFKSSWELDVRSLIQGVTRNIRITVQRLTTTRISFVSASVWAEVRPND